MLQILHEGTPAWPTPQPPVSTVSLPLPHSGPVPQNFFTFSQLARCSLAFRLLNLSLLPSARNSLLLTLAWRILGSWSDVASCGKPPSRVVCCPHCNSHVTQHAVPTATMTPPSLQRRNCLARCLREGELAEDRDSPGHHSLICSFVLPSAYPRARHCSSKYSSERDRKTLTLTLTLILERGVGRI